jgi:hypothetical protein
LFVPYRDKEVVGVFVRFRAPSALAYKSPLNCSFL